MRRGIDFLIVNSSLLLLLSPALLQPQTILFPQPLSPRIANYDIEVRLDTKSRILHGKETLIWFNKTENAITELQFHLYLNAFRNDRSTFMKESSGSSRGYKLDKDGWGYTEVNSIRSSDGTELVGNMEFIRLDDGNPDDKTVFRLPLPAPLPPGDSIRLNIDFTAKLPTPPFARSGAKKEYFLVGQWFPKVGVLQNGGWNCHQYHANSEFFADYGVYHVAITVPERNIVGATGIEVNKTTNNDSTVTHHFFAEDVHDFAWTTSSEFIEFTGKAQDVDIRVLMQPDHAGQGSRHLEAAKAAVEYFQNWYGDYPYPNLTVVDPRRGADGSGGMEYPTLITAFTFYGMPAGLRLVEFVIIHEFGHNYWYHLVGSNEFEEAWLDEGINTFSEIQIMHDKYGPVGDAINVLGIKINDLQLQRAQYLALPDYDPIVRKAWEFYSSGSYAINSYSKPGLVLTTLQNYLGKDTMQKIMRTYFARWRFRHPTTQDFINVANEVSGQDLNWFFNQALFTNAVLDYSVDRVSTRAVEAAKGYDFDLPISAPDTVKADSTNDSTEVTRQQPDSSLVPLDTALMDSDKKDSAVVKEKKEKIYDSVVKIRRLGSFIFPVDVEVVFANGDTVRESWDGKELWKRFHYTKPVKLVSATVDPQRKIPLDVNYTNNSRTVEAQKIGVNKLSARWLFWMQFLLDQPESLKLLSALGISM